MSLRKAFYAPGDKIVLTDKGHALDGMVYELVVDCGQLFFRRTKGKGVGEWGATKYYKPSNPKRISRAEVIHVLNVRDNEQWTLFSDLEEDIPL